MAAVVGAAWFGSSPDANAGVWISPGVLAEAGSTAEAGSIAEDGSIAREDGSIVARAVGSTAVALVEVLGSIVGRQSREFAVSC